MKLGDAIIAAIAVAYNILLVTRNEDDFKHIPGLDSRNPFAIAPSSRSMAMAITHQCLLSGTAPADASSVQRVICD